MSSVDEFNFEAPQYVESLANIEEVDDGADNFFGTHLIYFDIR